ncbi:MAG: PilZ domain-containing protein [Ornithinibacter sp.]
MTEGNVCLTGIVLDEEGDDVVVVDLRGSPPPKEPTCEVLASFFSPDALYRTEASLAPHDGREMVFDLTIHQVERIQRRGSRRARVTLPVVLSNFDSPDPDAGSEVFASVTGESIDVGEGGCRVVTERRFPPSCDPTVMLHLSPDEELVALAAVLEERPTPDGRFEYRLVFIDPEDDHRERLAQVVAAAA